MSDRRPPSPPDARSRSAMTKSLSRSNSRLNRRAENRFIEGMSHPKTFNSARPGPGSRLLRSAHWRHPFNSECECLVFILQQRPAHQGSLSGADRHEDTILSSQEIYRLAVTVACSGNLLSHTIIRAVIRHHPRRTSKSPTSFELDNFEDRSFRSHRNGKSKPHQSSKSWNIVPSFE